jgi:hypothetical protein
MSSVRKSYGCQPQLQVSRKYYYIVAALVSVNYCTTSMLNNRGMCVVQGIL